VRTPDDVLGGLARSYLFEDLTRTQLEPHAATATTRTLVRGEYAFHIGDPANERRGAEREMKNSVVDAGRIEVVHFVHGPG
jgi:hypothetical protein